MAIRKEKKIPTSKCKLDVRTEIYSSANELVADNKNHPIRWSEYDVVKHGIKKDWHGVNDYQEALDLLAGGYQPVVETLKEEIKVTPKYAPRFAFSNEVQGFLPIVPLALKGVPTSMLDMRIRPMKAKVIDVYYDMTATCEKSVDDFIRAGKVLLGTILALENQGYRFNLYAIQTYFSTGGGSERSMDILCVKIKSSNSPFDIKRMSFPLTHPSFFRVIGFDWQAKSPITRYAGYGRGRGLSDEFNKEDCTTVIKNMFGDNAIYLSCTSLIRRRYNKETLKEAFTNDKVA